MPPIPVEALDDLAVGAWILGTGGGGDPHHALLNIQELYRQGHQVELINAEDLANDDLVAVVSSMGAPLVSQERITDPAMLTAAVRLMEEFLGREFAAVMSLEIGGANGLQPMLAAAVMDRPLVDADAMGRAFPTVFYTSFAVGELTCAPFSLWDIRGNGMVISEAEDWIWVERIGRRVCAEMGSRAFTCKAPRTGREIMEWGVLETVTQAIRIGQTVKRARAEHVDPIDAVLANEGGRRLFEGKVVDVARRVTGGYLRGQAHFEGLGPDEGSRFRIDFQNEFLVGWRDDQPVVMVPELICVLDSISGGAVGTEVLRYGQRITVVALPAPPVFLTPRGLQCTGPQAFGYDLSFRSLFSTK